MAKPKFRNPDKFQVLEHREWVRNNKPPGSQGYVAEDLDLVLRVYGAGYHTDATGKFMLLELKYRGAWINYAQKKTFGLMHELLRIADPERKRYIGYYVVQYTDEDWDVARFRINKNRVTREEFDKFLSFDKEIIEKVDKFRETKRMWR